MRATTARQRIKKLERWAREHMERNLEWLTWEIQPRVKKWALLPYLIACFALVTLHWWKVADILAIVVGVAAIGAFYRHFLGFTVWLARIIARRRLALELGFSPDSADAVEMYLADNSPIRYVKYRFAQEELDQEESQLHEAIAFVEENKCDSPYRGAGIYMEQVRQELVRIRDQSAERLFKARETLVPASDSQYGAAEAVNCLVDIKARRLAAENLVFPLMYAIAEGESEYCMAYISRQLEQILFAYAPSDPPLPAMGDSPN